MQILVVGTGWLGSSVARRLADEHSVFATFRKNAVCLQNVLAFHFLPGQPLPQSDVVVLCFPPDRQKNIYADDCMAIVATQDENTRFLMCSSTSVISSPSESENLSGVSSPLSDAERQLSDQLGDRLIIVRFGGLIGPDRLPVRRMAEQKSTVAGNQVVNVIHREDATEIIRYVINTDLWGKIFAAVAPGHPSKYEFYSKMSLANNLAIPHFVESEKANFAIEPRNLSNCGYRFNYPSPFDFPELQR